MSKTSLISNLKFYKGYPQIPPKVLEQFKKPSTEPVYYIFIPLSDNIPGIHSDGQQTDVDSPEYKQVNRFLRKHSDYSTEYLKSLENELYENGFSGIMGLLVTLSDKDVLEWNNTTKLLNVVAKLENEHTKLMLLNLGSSDYRTWDINLKKDVKVQQSLESLKFLNNFFKVVGYENKTIETIDHPLPRHMEKSDARKHLKILHFPIKR